MNDLRIASLNDHTPERGQWETLEEPAVQKQSPQPPLLRLVRRTLSNIRAQAAAPLSTQHHQAKPLDHQEFQFPASQLLLAKEEPHHEEWTPPPPTFSAEGTAAELYSLLKHPSTPDLQSFVSYHPRKELGEMIHQLQTYDPLLLHQVIALGNPYATQILLAFGFNPNTQNEKGETPLHLAVRFRRYTLFKTLLARGADLYQQNNAGLSPWNYMTYSLDDRFRNVVPTEQMTIYVFLQDRIQSLSAEAFSTLFDGKIHYIDHLLFSDITLLRRIKNRKSSRPAIEPKHPPLYIKWIDEEIGWGAFALRRIEPGEIVGEYTGVALEGGLGNSYTMHYLEGDVGIDIYIDATKFGNETRFINHSASPNGAFIEAFCSLGLPIICFQATKPIKKDEQVLANYGPNYFSYQHRPQSLTP